MSRLDPLLHEAQSRTRRNRAIIISSVVLVIFVVVFVSLAIIYLDRLKIEVAPKAAIEGADIEMLNGMGLVLGDNLIAIKDDLTLRIASPGFRSQELTVADATWRRGRLDVVLVPLPAELTARTNPELPDVRWYLDDVFVAQSPGLNVELKPGDYTIRAQHRNFEPASVAVSLDRAESHSLSLELVPVQGTVEISSEPTGASVMLDSVAVGETPLKLDVDSGPHDIDISYPHYATRTDTITVTSENRQISRHYELVPANQKVVFSLTPEDGLLTLDRVVIPTQRQPSVSLAVNSRHLVEYSKPGFRTQRVEFTVMPDSTNEVALTLQPIYGTVNVRSDPTAEVSVNGSLIGRTPMQLKLQAIPQTVTLSRSGYVSQTRTVTPDEQLTKEVSVELVSEQAHRLSTSPDDLVNSIGMELKLFKKPDAFRMGSARGEPDGRPNEFARQIQLTRPFYAGVYEVTVDEYQQFGAPGQTAAGNRKPMTGVSWLAAVKFCNWLSDKEDLKPVYQFSGDAFTGSEAGADGYRLLTEAEWEWLARKAGRVQQTTFPWGNRTTIPANTGNLADESARTMVARYIPQYNDGQSGLSETGMFQSNPVGIHDLAGNASEWTHDSYTHARPTGGDVEVNPFDQSAARWRTIKGANFQSARLRELRVAFRRGSAMGDATVGFRVARYLY